MAQCADAAKTAALWVPVAGWRWRIDWLHADGAILPLGGVACRERRAERRGALAIPLPDDLHKIRVTGKGADGGATIPRLLLGGSDRLHRNSIAVGCTRNFGLLPSQIVQFV